MRERLLRTMVPAAVLAAGAVLFAATIVQPACTVKGACDETPGVDYCKLVGDAAVNCPGNRIGLTRWESSPLKGKWLFFPRNSGLNFDPRDPDGGRIVGEITSTVAWISVCENPVATGCNYVVASGNNAEFTVTSSGTFWIKNNTCADFWIRVVMESDGVGPDTGVVAPIDTGVDSRADASSQDGTIDASSD